MDKKIQNLTDEELQEATGGKIKVAVNGQNPEDVERTIRDAFVNCAKRGIAKAICEMNDDCKWDEKSANDQGNHCFPNLVF